MKEQGYQYTTDLLVIGCGFSGMWAAMRARDFLGDVLVGRSEEHTSELQSPS